MLNQKNLEIHDVENYTLEHDNCEMYVDKNCRWKQEQSQFNVIGISEQKEH